jgi:acetoin utilization deacetylase AcuC-like enzyme
MQLAIAHGSRIFERYLRKTSLALFPTSTRFMAEFNTLSTDSPSDNTKQAKRTAGNNKAAPISIFFHDECVKHCIEGHPEQPDRVAYILKSLRENFPPEHFIEAPLCSDDHILMFHTEKHLSLFKSLCDEAEKAPDFELQSIDGDTTVMRHTRNAAYRAVGAIVAAVDKVYGNPEDNHKTAFCCVRPPGHHAERDKACGFCFLSNAAIGARYAQEKYGVKKVAVVDFDVHHGNGTEEGFTPDETLFYGSTHELGNFPGTGKDPSPYVGSKARKPIHRRIVDREIRSGKRSVREFHTKWAQVIDEMTLFKPDLVIISAGFDAHDEDPLSDIELLEPDFAWATKIVMEACVKINPQSPVPVISILEGGYNLDALAASALAHVQVLAGGYPKSPGGVDEADSAGDADDDDVKGEGSDDAAKAKSKYGGDEAAALADYVKGLNL